MKKYHLMSLLFIIISLTANSQVTNLKEYYAGVDKLLSTNVVAGKVNYKAIKKNSTDLNSLIKFAGTKQNFVNATDEKAFYLNTYNMIVIKAIIDAYPTKGPMEIKGFFDKKSYTVNGVSITLNGIENDIVRKKYNDARIHFALVCGAQSCPPIQIFAFVPEKLDAQLEMITKQSIQNSNFTKVDAKKNKVQLSMIFNWYKDDFIKAKGSALNFVNSYLKTPLLGNVTVEFYPYDWALNTQ